MINSPFLIYDPEIISFINEDNYCSAAKRLIQLQKKSWDALDSGYQALKTLKTKTINFDGFSFIIQFNPARIASSSALIDEISVKTRKCFLCNSNRPVQQKGILINNYLLLVNPFPLFPEHFTLSFIDHIGQRIDNNFDELLRLSRLLCEDYTVFYNGPQCGASAPDHMHFQAGNKSSLPFFSEYKSLKTGYGELLSDKNDVIVIGLDDGLRKIICLESKDKNKLSESFKSFYNIYDSYSEEPEPMMNILSLYEEAFGWRIAVMLRAKHRPEEFYKEEEGRILYSPAASDFGGLCITPLQRDFDKFNKELLTKIFNDVSIEHNIFYELKKDIKVKLG